MTSGGNNFSAFIENQLTIDFAFLGKPTWRNATVWTFRLVLISSGDAFALSKIFGGNGVPRRLHHCTQAVSLHITILQKPFQQI